MEVSTIIFFSLLLCGVKAIYADASLAALAARVRLVEREINLGKLDAVKTDTKLIDKFEVLESSLKEELTERFLPLLIKPLVKQAITDIMNEDYIGNIITGHVLREVQSLKANVQNTKTQLKTLAEQLRRVERDRDTYRKSLRKQRRSLTKDIRELQIQLNHTVADLRDARTTAYPLTTAASTDPSPSNTASLAPVTTQDSDLQASTDPSPNTTVPPTPVTTQDSDPHATPSPAAGHRLYSASGAGDLETVKRILAAGHVEINTRGGDYSKTPVMAAALSGHSDVVEFLVGRGADVSLVDSNGNNVLHVACLGGDLETVKLIVSRNLVDVNARNKDGRTAVYWARVKGHQRVVEFMVSRAGH
ncbi:ankyrin repeat domain-containing protein 27-like isoform X2 [Haliotis rubra]|uniref:ankyrin repeat domain-containing protein 27-like isoform X2 n=1 Tax=Haliotis rubra TaxID=36100 RepID=UPI001EE60377|nr:ankyrin repeat domain-containing protein 27-like isoform X2 [Haliotis rubra]